MGHADITTTMNIYAEATKEKKQQAMANLNGKIDGIYKNGELDYEATHKKFLLVRSEGTRQIKIN